MKQKKIENTPFRIRFMSYAFVIIASFFTHYINAVTYTFKGAGDSSNFTITTTWDDSLACQGSQTTILYNIQLSSPAPSGAYPFYFQGFVPASPGFTCPIIIPPAPSGYTPWGTSPCPLHGESGYSDNCGGYFDPSASPILPGNEFQANSCSSSQGQTPFGCALGLGVWSLSNPFPTVSTGFDMSVTVTLTECGALTFFPCTIYGSDLSENNCVVPQGITFTVVPHAELEDVVSGPICQGTTFTGTLPGPICTSQLGFQCPNCVPCTACNGFTFTTAATSCIACSGATGTGCVCNCNLCSGYTGCPPCTSCIKCTGCTACSGYTGPCGPQPINFTVGNAVGGSINLVDPTGGIFEFSPNNTFYGTASFQYNVLSEWNPIIFCPAITAALYEITYAQNPVTNLGTITGCAGTGITGTLVPFVTGGSGSYTFNQTGPATCGSIAINPNGSYTFISPTAAPTTCEFVYVATDNAYPNCVGTGVVLVVVNELPIAVSDTLSACVNITVTGTVTATNGLAPYTFALLTFPTNGTLTPASDFATSGNFTYAPNLNFTGIDSFTFSVTDANGCISVPVGTETIDINPIPIAGSTAINGCTNTTLTGSLVSLVTNGTGPLVFSQGSNPSCGGVFITSDGQFIFSPNFGYTGSCCFDYFVTQGGCPATGPGQVCIQVQPGPIGTGSEFGVCPSGTVTGNLNDNIINATPPITFILVSTFGGVMDFFDATTGDYIFTTTISSGNAGFNFQIDDGFPCLSAVQTVLIDVHPKPTTVTGTLQDCDNVALHGNLNSLVSGDGPFTFTGPFTQVGGTAVINSSGNFTFVPTVGVTGGSFTYGVASYYGCTGSGLEVIKINPAPVATGSRATGCAQSALSGDLTPLVSGGTPPYVNFQLASVPINGSAFVSSTGAYVFTPNAGVNNGSFNYQVTDSNGCMDIGTIAVGVNPGATATTGHFTGCGNGVEANLIDLVSGVSPFTFTAPIGPVFNGTVMLTDVNNGTFIFISTFPAPTQGSFNYQVTDSSVPACTSKPIPVYINIIVGPEANPAHFTGCENQSFSGSLTPFVTGGTPPYIFSFTGALPSCASSVMITPDGEMIFVPALNFSGPCSFDYCIADSIPCTDCSTITVQVQPSPVATNSGPFTGCVNDPFIGNLNNFMASGTPPFSFTGGNEINGTLMLAVTGPFAFTPAALGSASFDYSAIDFYGCQSNTGIISVNAQESPTIIGTSPLDTCQGTPVTGNVTATSSPELLPLTFSIAPGSQVNGSATVTPTSATTADFTFTPNVVTFPTPTIIGAVTIRVTASNGCYADFPVTIDIHQNPIAGNTGLGNCSPIFTGSLTGLVSGGVLPYTFSQFNGFIPPGCGSVVIDPNGTYVYTANGTGPCTFFYQVTEDSTSACVSTGAVTITTSIPPVVTNYTTCACYNVPISINLNTLTSGGVPPYTFAIVGTPVGGTVFLNPITGIATFKPTSGFNGVGSFQFQAFDSFNPPCASNIGTVTIPVPCC